MKKIFLYNLFILQLILSFFVWSLVPVRAYYLETNQSADVVIGQVDFTHNSANQGQLNPLANTLKNPRGVSICRDKLIILDKNNNRVLIYNSIPTSNNASADVVIGQSNFESNSAGTLINKLSAPNNVYCYGDKLFIVDSGNNRVLIYNSIPTSNNASADVVIGQVDFNSGQANQGNASNPSANSLQTPSAVWVNNEKLFIADSYNYRLLIYNSIPTSNNASADVVIGQVDFNARIYNEPSANKLRYVDAVWSDGAKLIVDDAQNNRVLIFNNIPNGNYASADIVIGQVDLNSNISYPINSNTVVNARGIYSDGTRLFLADNHRIIVFNNVPTSNNASADVVIGQVDFTHNSANQGGAVDESTLNIVAGIFADDRRLIVSDYSNNRVLIYNFKINAPIILNPQTLSSTSIRWNFTDNDTIETGFKLYDNSNNLVSTNSTANLSYIDETNLSPNTQYSGRYVKAYNNGGESSTSQSASSIYTFAPTPTNLTATPSLNTMSISVDQLPNDTIAQSGYYFESSSGNNSGWIQTNTWQETNLHYGKEYTYTVKYRNGDAIETSTISTTQSTPFASFGTIVIQPQIEQPQITEPTQSTQPTQTQEQVQQQEQTPQQPPQQPQLEQLQTPQLTREQLITELKAKLAELIAQLIVLLQEKVRNR